MKAHFKVGDIITWRKENPINFYKVIKVTENSYNLKNIKTGMVFRNHGFHLTHGKASLATPLDHVLE